MEKEYFHHALLVDKDLCIGCTHCMKVCPTEAIRIRNGLAIISENRCVDCGNCMRACPVSAIRVDQDDFNMIYRYEHRVVIFPAILIGQFLEEYAIEQIYSVLKEMGFTHVYEVEHGVDVLCDNQQQMLGSTLYQLPAISSFCPAIIRLIQVKFPSLVQNILPLKAPLDITARYLKQKLVDEGCSAQQIGIFYVTPCAAKIAAVKCPVGEDRSIIDGVINMNFIYNKVYRSLKQNKPGNNKTEKDELTSKGITWSLTGGETRHIKGRSLAIDGIHNVIEFLEKLENNEIEDIDFLELRACEEGCAGGILTSVNRFLTVENMRNMARETKKREDLGQAVNQEIEKYHALLSEYMKLGAIKPRSMMKLDEDMARAMEKMQLSQKIIKYLPRIDCGACGAPNCEALSEDIAQGLAEVSHCIFIQKAMVLNKNLSLDQSAAITRKVWGNERVDQNINNAKISGNDSK